MAIVEKRQLFRLNDDIRLSYLRLNDEEVNDAINQLSTTSDSKNLFPQIEESQETLNSNITVFGLSFPSKESFIENTHLSLSVLLSSAREPIYAVGKVAYCKFNQEKSNYKIGVRFKFMAKEDMQVLEEYLVDKLQEGLSKHVPEKKMKDDKDDF